MSDFDYDVYFPDEGVPSSSEPVNRNTTAFSIAILKQRFQSKYYKRPQKLTKIRSSKKVLGVVYGNNQIMKIHQRHKRIFDSFIRKIKPPTVYVSDKSGRVHRMAMLKPKQMDTYLAVLKCKSDPFRDLLILFSAEVLNDPGLVHDLFPGYSVDDCYKIFNNLITDADALKKVDTFYRYMTPVNRNKLFELLPIDQADCRIIQKSNLSLNSDVNDIFKVQETLSYPYDWKTIFDLVKCFEQSELMERQVFKKVSDFVTQDRDLLLSNNLHLVLRYLVSSSSIHSQEYINQYRMFEQHVDPILDPSIVVSNKVAYTVTTPNGSFMVSIQNAFFFYDGKKLFFKPREELRKKENRKHVISFVIKVHKKYYEILNLCSYPLYVEGELVLTNSCKMMPSSTSIMLSFVSKVEQDSEVFLVVIQPNPHFVGIESRNKKFSNSLDSDVPESRKVTDPNKLSGYVPPVDKSYNVPIETFDDDVWMRDVSVEPVEPEVPPETTSLVQSDETIEKSAEVKTDENPPEAEEKSTPVDDDHEDETQCLSLKHLERIGVMKKTIMSNLSEKLNVIDLEDQEKVTMSTPMPKPVVDAINKQLPRVNYDFQELPPEWKDGLKHLSKSAFRPLPKPTKPKKDFSTNGFPSDATLETFLQRDSFSMLNTLAFPQKASMFADVPMDPSIFGAEAYNQRLGLAPITMNQYIPTGCRYKTFSEETKVLPPRSLQPGDPVKKVFMPRIENYKAYDPKWCNHVKFMRKKQERVRKAHASDAFNMVRLTFTTYKVPTWHEKDPATPPQPKCSHLSVPYVEEEDSVVKKVVVPIRIPVKKQSTSDPKKTD